jgi:hypothetical protein
MTVSWRHGELLGLKLSYCIVGKKCEGDGHRKQRLGIGGTKEIPRNDQVWKADERG